MAASARDWSVAKLRALNFEGDADALAAYVDALIENNRDVEGGDPALLRKQATDDLGDFLGPDDATSFVQGLMTHLGIDKSPSSPRDDPPPVQSAADAAVNADADADLNPAQTQDPPSSQNHTEQQQIAPKSSSLLPADTAPKPPPSSARDNGRPQHDRKIAHDNAPDRRKRSPQRSRERPARYNGSDDRQQRQQKPSIIKRLGDRPDIRDLNQDVHSRQPFQRSQSFDRRLAPQSHPLDLRDKLGKRTNLPKRPREDDNDPQSDYRDSRRKDRSDRPDPAKYPRRSDPNLRSRGDVSTDRRRHQPRQNRAMDDDNQSSQTPAWNPVPVETWDTPNDDENMDGPPATMPWPPPPPPPQLLKQMQSLMKGKGAPPGPFPAGLMPPPPMAMNNMKMPPQDARQYPNRGGRMRDRGGHNRNTRGGRHAQTGTGPPSGRAMNSVLLMRPVPEDKLKLPPILDFFQKFGTPDNVHLVPPDRAFIFFGQRDQAQAAMDSVDAVMGNRHIKLHWARESDFTQAGLSIPEDGMVRHTGRPVSNGKSGRTNDRQSTPTAEEAKASAAEAAKEAEEKQERDRKAAEEDLQAKRKVIAAAREEQDKRKAELQANYDRLITQQRDLFSKISSCSPEEKKEMFAELKNTQEQAAKVLLELKPRRALAGSAEDGNASAAGQGHTQFVGFGLRGRGKRGRAVGRPIGTFSVDNRPKVVRISGAISGLAPETAASIFRDTERAELNGDAWMLYFATRRAAESAIRAYGVLKRGFGPAASAEIVSKVTAAPVVVAIDAHVTTPDEGPTQVAAQPIAE